MKNIEIYGLIFKEKKMERVRIFNDNWKIERINMPKPYTQDIYEYFGRIASICSGVELDRERCIKLGKKMQTEAAGNTPNKVYEYLPIYSRDTIFYDSLIYKNMRELIKVTNPENPFEYYEDFCRDRNKEDFFVFKCTAPQFVWSHIATHRQLSPLKRSVRMGKEEEFEFWLPEPEKEDGVFTKNQIRNAIIEAVEDTGKKRFKKELMANYTRKEIYNRWPGEFRLVDFIICGHRYEFDNFFAERIQAATQKETRVFAETLLSFIGG